MHTRLCNFLFFNEARLEDSLPPLEVLAASTSQAGPYLFSSFQSAEASPAPRPSQSRGGPVGHACPAQEGGEGLVLPSLPGGVMASDPLSLQSPRVVWRFLFVVLCLFYALESS